MVFGATTFRATAAVLASGSLAEMVDRALMAAGLVYRPTLHT